jgi:hypothetical protein
MGVRVEQYWFCHRIFLFDEYEQSPPGLLGDYPNQRRSVKTNRAVRYEMDFRSIHAPPTAFCYNLFIPSSAK